MESYKSEGKAAQNGAFQVRYHATRCFCGKCGPQEETQSSELSHPTGRDLYTKTHVCVHQILRVIGWGIDSSNTPSLLIGHVAK